MMVAREITMWSPRPSIDGETVAVRLSQPFLIKIRKSISASRSIMKSPLCSRACLLGRHKIEILLIRVPCLKECLEIILLNLLANHELQRLSLKELIGLLLGP